MDQTLGKMALGIKVLRFDDGRLPSWGSATIRWAVPMAFGMLPGLASAMTILDDMWMLWDPNRQSPRQGGSHGRRRRDVNPRRWR